MSRSPSNADQQVIDAARAVGLEVTPAKLERWRRTQLIPRTNRRSLGRGRGTTSGYDTAAIEYIVGFASHVTARRPLWTIPAAMFTFGDDVPEGALRASYSQLLDSIESELSAGFDGDELDQAEAAAARLQRRPGAGLRAQRKRRREQLKSLDSDDLATGQADRPSYRSYEESLLINQILSVVAPTTMAQDGVRELADDHMHTIRDHVGPLDVEIPSAANGDFLDALSKTFNLYTLDELRATADRAPITVLRASLDGLTQLFPTMLSQEEPPFSDLMRLALPLVGAIFFRTIIRLKQNDQQLEWVDIERLL